MKSSQVPLLLPVIASRSKWQTKENKETVSQEANVNYNSYNNISGGNTNTKSKHHTTSFEQFSRMMQTRNVTQRLLRRFPFGHTNSLIYLNEMPSFVKTDLIHAAILKLHASESHINLETEKEKEHSKPHLNSHEVSSKFITEIKKVNRLYYLYNACLHELMRLNAPRAEVAHAALQQFLHRERNRVKLMSSYANINKENEPSTICEPLLALPITENESAAIGLCIQTHSNAKRNEQELQKRTKLSEPQSVQPSVITSNKSKSMEITTSYTICVNTFLSSPRVDYRALPQLYLLAIPIRTPHHSFSNNYLVDKDASSYEIMRKRVITQFVQSHLVYDTSSQQLVLRKITYMERRELEHKTKAQNGNNDKRRFDRNTSCVDINEEEAFLVQGYSLSPDEAVQAAMALLTKTTSHKSINKEENANSSSETQVLVSEWQYHLIFLCPFSAASVHSILGVNNRSNNSVTDPASAVPLSELATLYPSLFVNYHMDIPAQSQQAIHSERGVNNNNYNSFTSKRYVASVDSAIPLQMKKMRFTTPIAKEKYDISNTLQTIKSEHSSKKLLSQEQHQYQESGNVSLLNLSNHGNNVHGQGNTHLWANPSAAEKALSTVNGELLSTASSKGEVYSSRNLEMNELQVSFAHAQEKLIRAHLLSHNKITTHHTSNDHSCVNNTNSLNNDKLAIHGTKEIEQTSGEVLTKQDDSNWNYVVHDSHEGITSLDVNRIAFVPFTAAEVKLPYTHMQLAEIWRKEECEEKELEEEQLLTLSNKIGNEYHTKQTKKKIITKHANKKAKNDSELFDKSEQLPLCLQAIEQRKLYPGCRNESLLAPKMWKCLNKAALSMWTEKDKEELQQQYEQKVKEASQQILPLGLENIIDAREHVVLPFLRKTRKLPLSYFRNATEEQCCNNNHFAKTTQKDSSANTCSSFVPMLWTLSEINTLLGWTRYALLFEERYGLLRHLLSTDVYTLIGAAHHRSIHTECTTQSEQPRYFATQEPFLLIHDTKFVQKVLLPSMYAFHAYCKSFANSNKYARQMQYMCYRHQANLERWCKMTLAEEMSQNNHTKNTKKKISIQTEQQQQQTRKVPWQAKTFIHAMIAKRSTRKGRKINKSINEKTKEKKKKTFDTGDSNLPELCVIPIMPFLEWATLHPSEWSHDVSKMLPHSVIQNKYTKVNCKDNDVDSEITNQVKRNSFYSYKDMMRVMHYFLCYEDLFCLVGNDGTTVAFMKSM